MRRIVNAVHQNVHFALVFGEPAGELFTNQHIGERQNFLRAPDRVVIGQRDEIHPAIARLFINASGGTVAFGATDGVERGFAGFVAGTAVTMKIDATGRAAPGE